MTVTKRKIVITGMLVVAAAAISLYFQLTQSDVPVVKLETIELVPKKE